MAVQIQAKQGNFQALCYNSWAPILFGTEPAPVTSASAVLYYPLGLNYKFTHFSYKVLPGITPGLNLVLNVGNVGNSSPSHPARNTSYGYFDIGGTFLSGDIINLTIAGVLYSFTVTTRQLLNTVSPLGAIMAQFTNDLNYNPLFNVGYVANSLGAEMVIQPLTYAAVTPSYSVATTSVAGTATAGGATFVAGTGGGSLLITPPLDQTSQGISPSAVGLALQAMSPVDIILPTFTAQSEGNTGTVYFPQTFDAIWPVNTSMSITAAANGGIGTGGCIINLYGVPVDNHRFLPATLPLGFQVNSEVL